MNNSNFPNVLRTPDNLIALTDEAAVSLRADSDTVWSASGLRVTTGLEGTSPETTRLSVAVESKLPLRKIILRWHGTFPGGTRFLGDAWERGYGDLEWRGLVPERALPWYFLAYDGKQTTGYGVETGPKALCHWMVDEAGISLHLDVRCGTVGVQLGERQLPVAVIRSFGSNDLSPFATAQAFCRLLCPAPRLPKQPVYGGNDWYYAYGNNSRATILRDAATMRELSPDGDNHPFMVIDDGWQQCRYPANGGPWRLGNNLFGEMSEVAQAMKAMQVRPGLWFRPLLTAENLPHHWRFKGRGQQAPDGLPLDPSLPEVLELVAAEVRRFREWGFELLKHDFSTFDIFWKWGFEFGADPARGTWHFADQSHTSAEIITQFNRTLREAAGDDVLLLGCNTIGHLGAGYFEIQRTGDDTSGTEWERTRKMGINTLAFRMAQHETFFVADADCVGLTNQIPWRLNKQWLDVLARSGTPLFVSADPQALGTEQKAALRDAFFLAATAQTPSEPLDWLDTTCPILWRSASGTQRYSWSNL